MFELEKASSFISSFNPRAEKHGEDNKLAADIKVELQLHNSALDSFHKDLRPALFRKPAKGEQQDLIDKDAMTAVKFPRLGAISWDEEFTGYEIEIGIGLGLSEPLFMADVTVKKFRFEPLEGGSVSVTFSVICHPDAEEAGLLCGLIQSDVELTLTPPSKQAEELPKAA